MKEKNGKGTGSFTEEGTKDSENLKKALISLVGMIIFIIGEAIKKSDGDWKKW